MSSGMKDGPYRLGTYRPDAAKYAAPVRWLRFSGYIEFSLIFQRNIQIFTIKVTNYRKCYHTRDELDHKSTLRRQVKRQYMR